METHNQENRVGMVACKWDCGKDKVIEIASKAKKIGKDDPRKVVHSMKVGSALTLVSLLYYFTPLYDGFGEAGMWAILTVVVVFEFTVGGTLSKSLNRGFATLVAAALGVGAEYLAGLSGEKGEPILRAIFVFVIATAATFIRFFPNVKSRYDYGVLIFILTFSLVAVSGFRVTLIIQLAHQRLATILIGGAACMLISIFVCPVWAGQDLHNLVAGNIANLAAFLDGFGGEFFSFPGNEGTEFGSHDQEDKSFLIAYKSVLNSKATEESLANFAWWEPGHGRFRFRQPWKQYLKIGVLARECAGQIDALSRCIKNSKPKVASEIHKKIQKPCTTMSIELGKGLKELSCAIKDMKFPSSAVETFIQNSKAASDDLKNILEVCLQSKHDLQEIMQLLMVASALTDIFKSVEKLLLPVHQLAQKARFEKAKSPDKQQQLIHAGIVNPNDEGGDRVVIDIYSVANDSSEKKSSSNAEI
ncbi:hypothetical protein BUALT_Bualt09G0099500 [Buddleja alternifolia]|uniref:Aluminum-activated malate transporter n=1 Tax=Buddleja alternifolia TaxID=168488 RepID=A0AAV6XC11_9LAMI|nr:hypothetical protein BUALT_Bualt09G0099500 [Buddleja alternifolia]